MRPRTLAEFAGQEHIIGPGRLLRRAIESDRLFSSIIFWGPPGVGKTTLAAVIANTTSAHFETLNAVLAGVADLRKLVTEAQERRGMYGVRTILAIDEIHRWNKAQQDGLLPVVEDGTITLIGATTENPFFSIIAPLLSRSRIFRFEALTEAQIEALLRQALEDEERGYGKRAIVVAEDALRHLAGLADGDARTALNALELAVESTAPDADGVQRITLAVAEESIQRRAMQYDKSGDEHYNTISAFIKSIRGSDPDAAVHYLARLLEAGDLISAARRLLVIAAEDVGLAYPQAMSIVKACVDSAFQLGLPEARIPLAEAVLLMATAPKSNSANAAIDAALMDVRQGKTGDIPSHLKDAHYSGAAHLGRGKTYVYPHDYPFHWAPQQYLPDALRDAHYYAYGDNKTEQTAKSYWERVKGQTNR